MKTLLSFILIGSLWSYKARALTAHDSISRKIVKIFESLSKNDAISMDKKYCRFEYKTGSEPDVDVIAIKGSDNQMILGSVDDKLVSKLIAQFETFCKECKFDSNQFNSFKKDNSFLVKGNYSLELNYASRESKTNNILCLIYGNKRYFLFSFGYNFN